jgi:hypothetical protein
MRRRKLFLKNITAILSSSQKPYYQASWEIGGYYRGWWQSIGRYFGDDEGGVCDEGGRGV